MNAAEVMTDLNGKYGPFQTKDGRPITLVVDENMVDPKRPDEVWMCHEVRAYVDGKEAGYLRIAHVTEELVNKHCPTVWHFMSQRKGWCIDLDDPLKLWRCAHLYANTRAASCPEIASNALCYSVPDTETIMMDLFALDAKRGLSAQFKHWCDDNIGYAFVDFSRAYDDFDIRDHDDRINCKGMGVGRALYAFAGQWLAEYYWLELHAAINRQEEATAVWKRLEADGYPVRLKRIKRDGKYHKTYTFLRGRG